MGLVIVEGKEPAAGQSDGNHTYRTFFINGKIILLDNKNNSLSQICDFNGLEEHSIRKSNTPRSKGVSPRLHMNNKTAGIFDSATLGAKADDDAWRIQEA